MRIQKYLHSCIGIAYRDQRVLIDPGSFSFAEGILQPDDIPSADIILLTHEHPDHYYPDALKAIARKKKPIILTHENLAPLLEEQGLGARVVRVGETIRQGAFTIQPVEAPHGDLPMPKPENLGFLINDSFLHPGDSLAFHLPFGHQRHRFALSHLPKHPRALALPITAPWLILKDALDAAVRIKPEFVIPIHDAIMKDFMLEWIYRMCEIILTGKGIIFHPLKLGETLEV